MKKVTSEPEYENLSAETSDPNPEIMFTPAVDPKNRSKPQFWKLYNCCHKSNHTAPNCFRKQCEDKKQQNSYSRSKSTVKSFNKCFEAYQNQINSD